MNYPVTIVIPVGPGHHQSGLYREAVASAEGQSIPCAVEVEIDAKGRGAGWARNQAMQRVKTPLVVFLDADDTLESSFVEDTIGKYKRGFYVYTDYSVLDEGREKMFNRTPWCLDMLGIGQQHITTVLLPTIAWRNSGGFDESLPMLEDEDFFRRLHLQGWCGVRCPKSLVNYRRIHGNSLSNKNRHDLDIIQEKQLVLQAQFRARYGGVSIMACGCNQAKKQTGTTKTPNGERGSNDVLAKANYAPMTKVGPVTARRYPRTGMGRLLWVDHDDAEARPEWWQIVAESPANIAPDAATVVRLAQEAKRKAS